MIEKTRGRIMANVSIEVLEGIERFAGDNPDSPVAQMHREMIAVIGPDAAAGNPGIVSRFSDLYRNESSVVFPASNSFLAASRNVG